MRNFIHFQLFINISQLKSSIRRNLIFFSHIQGDSLFHPNVLIIISIYRHTNIQLFKKLISTIHIDWYSLSNTWSIFFMINNSNYCFATTRAYATNISSFQSSNTVSGSSFGPICIIS